MTLALIGALAIEVAPLIRAAQAQLVARRLGQPIYRGRIGAAEVLIAELGMGKVRAAAVLQSLVERNPIEAVICCGSAGAINPALNVGDIVVAQRVVQHDFVLPSPRPVLADTHAWIKTDARLAAQLLAAGARAGFDGRIRLGAIITGDSVIAENATRQRLWQTYRADGVEMEGAAVGLVCQWNEIPFAVVRGLTDKADEEETDSFRKHIKQVAGDVARVVVEYVAY